MLPIIFLYVTNRQDGCSYLIISTYYVPRIIKQNLVILFVIFNFFFFLIFYRYLCLNKIMYSYFSVLNVNFIKNRPIIFNDFLKLTFFFTITFFYKNTMHCTYFFWNVWKKHYLKFNRYQKI